MIKKVLILSALVLTACFTYAQDILYCGQTEATERLFGRFPHVKAHADSADAALEAFTQSRAGGGDEVYVIPVVFHVIHSNGPENISDEQIYDAMYILNRDFKLENEDLDDVIPEFIGIAADIDIEFRLATLDPSGNCTKGINRLVSPLTYAGDEEMKQLIQWPREKYLNVWVCAYANGAAGYTLLPGSVDNFFNEDMDGIVLKHDYTGSIGTSSVSSSRTLTHEVGHWLNLRHCWGQGNTPGQSSNCNQDDNVSDTPNSIGWSSCALQGESCGSLNNVQNYMEYSYCSRMFTEGQRSRMRSAAQSNTADRNNLWTQANREATGTWSEDLSVCTADFTSAHDVVCLGDSVYFSDESFHNIQSWTWDFGDGTTLSGTDPLVYKDPVHAYAEAGWYTVSLTVGDGINEESVTKTNYLRVLPAGDLVHPFVEGFEDDTFVDEHWFIGNYMNDQTWNTTTNAAATGDQCMYIHNHSNQLPENTDELFSSTIDCSEFDAVVFSYKWAYASKWTETNDRFRVRISPNCGEDWFTLEMHTGFTDLPTAGNTNSAFFPDADEWQEESLVVTNDVWLNEFTRFSFEFVGEGGNNIFIDDINITEEGYIGIDSQTDDRIDYLNLYPNPSQGDSRLDFFLRGAATTQIAVTDMLGREVLNQNLGTLAAGLHSFTVPSAKWGSGIYLVRVQQGNEVETLKLVVK
ncbi:MAG: T9SS type A sorting domain-containing protein [Flavobacteriales bacterium]|nr:T9SS type A sorting domain-containing protein [Flavobacteriales bacterium]